MSEELVDTVWEEKYRPTKLGDLLLPERMMNYFKNILDNPSTFPNMLFYSPSAGVFKTTCALVLANELKSRYKARWKKINSSLDGNKDTIKDEIVEWGSYNGFSKSPSIAILDEIDKSPKGSFLDPLLSSIETLNVSLRFIMTSNALLNFSDYADSRIEVINFTYESKEENIEVKKKLYDRLIYICENEKIKYDTKTLQHLIKTFYPDVRKVMRKLYLCYMKNGEVTGTDFTNTKDLGKYDQIYDLLLRMDFNSCRTVYNTIQTENDIFTALMLNLIPKIADADQQMKAVISIRSHMVPHQTVIDKELNIASMFAEIILILKNLK
jgi:replication-associated recombination protein RarA